MIRLATSFDIPATDSDDGWRQAHGILPHLARQPGRPSMTPYTLAKWHVHPGREPDFIHAWDRLARIFSSLPAPPLWGSLLQSEADPSLFYSFGPWRTTEDIQAMRSNADVQAAIETLRALCIEATPAAYRLVRHVDVHGE